jgi:hypothetical protein
MKIRLMGLPAEVNRVTEALHDARDFEVIQVDGPYPNRGDSRMVRAYIEVRLTEWCGRSWHDGDCCEESRKQWVGVQAWPVQHRQDDNHEAP